MVCSHLGGINLLDKLDAGKLRHAHASAAGNRQAPLRFFRKTGKNGAQHLHGLGRDLGKMALIGQIFNLIIFT